MISVELTGFSPHQMAILSIRFDVFVKEQGVDPSLEIDGQDPDCLHAIAYIDGKAVGTGRLLPCGHIGRMAVLPDYRSRGTGSAILRALMKAARDRGDTLIVIASQVHAAAFYKRFGFQSHGAPFIEAGIEHIHMQLQL